MSRGARHKHREEDEGVEGPLRRCIASGEARAPETMVRFVIGPDNVVTPDVAQKLPGRGVWVGANRALIQRAATKGLFAKAVKAPVTAPTSLADDVERLLAKRLQDHLGLARRAGDLTMGFQKVEEAFQTGTPRIAVLFEAKDSGPADRGKLLVWAKRYGDVTLIGCLSAEEIGLALGRESVVHAALTSGPLSARIEAEAKRLGGFRVLCPPEWGGGAAPNSLGRSQGVKRFVSDEGQ